MDNNHNDHNSNNDKDKKKNVIEREIVYPDPESVTGDHYFGATVNVKHTGSSAIFNVNENEVKLHDSVIIETRNGVCFGKVIQQTRKIDLKKPEYIPYRIFRKASSEDMEQQKLVEKKEQEAYEYTSSRIKEHKLVMKLVRVHYLHHGKKAIFFFTADGRVDFRELIKDLVKELKIRIEMRQIGVRDEAKYLGGYGPCGRELCCSTFLKNFTPVSIKMAKDQNIALNPTKVSGTCGRLQCCLSYEQDMYMEARKGIPSVGSVVVYEEKEYVVEAVSPLLGKLTVRDKNEGGALKVILHSEIKGVKEKIAIANLDQESIEELKQLEKLDSKEAQMRAQQEMLDQQKAMQEETGARPNNFRPGPRGPGNGGQRGGPGAHGNGSSGGNRFQNNNRGGQERRNFTPRNNNLVNSNGAADTSNTGPSDANKNVNRPMPKNFKPRDPNQPKPQGNNQYKSHNPKFNNHKHKNLKPNTINQDPIVPDTSKPEPTEE